MVMPVDYSERLTYNGFINAGDFDAAREYQAEILRAERPKLATEGSNGTYRAYEPDEELYKAVSAWPPIDEDAAISRANWQH